MKETGATDGRIEKVGRHGKEKGARGPATEHEVVRNRKFLRTEKSEESETATTGFRPRISERE